MLETNSQIHIYTKNVAFAFLFLKNFLVNYCYATDISLSFTKCGKVFQLHDSQDKERKHLVFQQKSIPLPTYVGEMESTEMASKVEPPPLMLPLFSWRQFVDDKGLCEPIMRFSPRKRASYGASQIVLISSLAYFLPFP